MTRFKIPVARMLIILSLFYFSSSVLAITPTQPPRATATLLPRQQIDLDATRILAGYTATAEAFPLAPEETEGFAAAAFGLGICSMLIVGTPLAFGLWRMNRRA
jgi:hypothetical protein